MCKMKFVKSKIREWIRMNRNDRKGQCEKYKKELSMLDDEIDNGNGSEAVVNKRLEVLNELQSIDKLHAMDMAQKAKIKWAIEGDENSWFFHGMLNRNCHQQSIRGVMADGVWKDKPADVKLEFLRHFSNRFDKPSDVRATIDMHYPRSLDVEQQEDLERGVSKEEIKKAVRDCGTDKFLGLDGYFFTNAKILKGYNSSYIALIPKVPDANMVKDFRPICLIGSMYKIIAKILTNRLVGVLGDIVSEVQSEFITERQILDGPFILNEVLQWCKKRRKGRLFSKWILRKRTTLFDGIFWIMESLHLSFQRVVETGLFMGIKLNQSVILSHMFYADDAVFVGQWSDNNINTLVYVMDCFYRASGLRINMSKSKIPTWTSLFIEILGGVEQVQYVALLDLVNTINLLPMEDKWSWSLESSGEFLVAFIRRVIDEKRIIARKIAVWWNVNYAKCNSYEEWVDWLVSLRLGIMAKLIFEGTFYSLWWNIRTY
uniref:Putative RNA-directed DNA polymerase, eukaryota, reverse transcriptase zinc-binding domain protein n=1 Tax=Tanacetum cinerariifolium TaxID=118510 RepID=A0A699I2C6_TANCI|nr:putative RNA-directed DNA polymerase, eukaryota, reverse transcriptase zinc-binding domain protein [Tanacetum cinerariifolium]